MTTPQQTRAAEAASAGEQLARELTAAGIEVGPPSDWDTHSGKTVWPTGRLRSHQLATPQLVAAIPLEATRRLVHTDPAWRWLAVIHQVAGIACSQRRMVAIPLDPPADVAAKLQTLAATYDGSNLGAFHTSLDELVAYREQLQSLLDVDCNDTYHELAEAIYPIDATPEHLERLGITGLPRDLNSLLTYDSQVASMAGIFGRWRLYLLTENSD